MDLSVFRTFKIGERLSLQLRGESFSTVNTPAWNNPDTNINNKTFGYITGAGGNRTVPPSKSRPVHRANDRSANTVDGSRL